MSQTKMFKPLSVHEHTHQIQTYCERKKIHVAVPLRCKLAEYYFYAKYFLEYTYHDFIFSGQMLRELGLKTLSLPVNNSVQMFQPFQDWNPHIC